MTSYNMLTDPELAVLLRNGNEAAFKVVYQTYWDKMLAVAGKRLGNLDEAEEAIQDIFLNLWKRREKFELRVNFEHYFAVAVKFEVINRLAKRSREQHRNNAFAQQNTGQFEPLQMRLDLEVLRKQLETTISSLPPKCQLVFRMSRESDFTNKKIATYLNISEKAVEKHVTTALKLLKSKFGPLLSVILYLITISK
ncbi:RNA polymerase sigma factor [Pedobacter hartonius]|uniref:RNA polymerase sigma-70 factor, ECF subfamily n=1 Tax=Pedobacter hartonius TaxID=425514 RepID=A0A1H4CT67_9SPHI|nr:sigma-70 family RNA polymerase sigma factor [Pedobacter hartonius]SEA63508.1 RNA polymerase sigma-70 factor, ECF subfamily [Pedobacter hartonius]